MNKEIFQKGLKELRLSATEEQIEKLQRYSALLVQWNQKMNLTAVTDDEGITVKHFLDSILLLRAVEIKREASVIDVGTGAGFPGLPIKIMREDLSVVFLDSLQKRLTFLQEVGKELMLDRAEYVHMRAEDAGRKAEHRERYDYAFSRAVADLKILCEYCLPLVKKGGIFVAFKSYGREEETERAKAMIGSLGGELREVKNLPLPQSDIIRSFVIIEKKRETPLQFPRDAGKIKKKKATGV